MTQRQIHKFLMSTRISRRSAICTLAQTTAVASVASSLSQRLGAADASSGPLKGRINHSVCKWCYGKISLEDLCQAGKEMGLQSIDLLETSDFETLKKHDLLCAMVSGVPGGISDGLNQVK